MKKNTRFYIDGELWLEPEDPEYNIAVKENRETNIFMGILTIIGIIVVTALYLLGK